MAVCQSRSLAYIIGLHKYPRRAGAWETFPVEAFTLISKLSDEDWHLVRSLNWWDDHFK